ncbi:ThiF family adenylyltransferase [Microvirga mediterraneensis]|uniref:ThiF family adenylyltransferase n=1 Tax=Microvirga mediterraneensis TaxID=2754695 RepID=A0A838BNZ4_9HYPH|nr:ThiF family adenylyltransferase [Microvirga mediterraneensis]MBA1157081.1 ThiF family adenylyltransferase [Microvirga mediterraneensis]
MSHAPFSRSADLRRLRDEGYFVQIQGGFLVMREVPYVDRQKQVRTGTLISSLTMAGDETRTPDTHVVHFDGDYPCRADGTPITGIAHQTDTTINLGHGLTARQSFSSKPDTGYTDYYHKMTSYVGILSGPAAILKPDATPRVFRAPEVEEDSVFNYTETASDRAGIGSLTERLASERVAIIGLGGTGAYVLDLVAKTPVREIRTFDGDEFLQHNAFRAPGAPSIDELREAPRKVDYLKGIYSKMHRGIVAHAEPLGASNLHLLDGITFAFLCMDAGEAKRLIVEKLEAIGVAFVDVGMGLELVEGSLGGILRVTASTPQKRDHVRRGRISFAGGGGDDLYSSNIQVADLNALNAALAVVKWKKIQGFYRDLEREHHSTYTTDGNQLENGDQE